jgi:hypothetical protein
VQIGEAKALHFTTIIDTSEEDEEDQEGQQTNEKYWHGKYPGAYGCAIWCKALLAKFSDDVRVRFVKGWITLYVGVPLRVAVCSRKNNRALISIEKLGETDLDDANERFNKERPVFMRRDNRLIFVGNLETLKETQAAHDWIAQRIANEK